MQIRAARTPLLVASIGLGALAACTQDAGISWPKLVKPEVARTSFAKNYRMARADLEAGRYDAARRRYLSLLTATDGYVPRMHIELAHAQLRSGDYAGAIENAQVVIDADADEWHGAALAVLGTAEHEIGRRKAREGDTAAKAHFVRALAALDDVLRTAPHLDPVGSLKKRREVLTRDIASFDQAASRE